MIKDAFPDYDTATLPAIPADWVDVSWHNDCSPSWQANGRLIVFVDYENEDDRELQCSRFAVHNVDCDCLLSTDDWQEVLTFVENYGAA